MLVAYLTTDEVNQDLATRLAVERGITVWPMCVRDGAADGEFNAVLYDWDYWPAEQRKELLAQWKAGPVSSPVAVHSYHLEEESEALVRNGVMVFRRLEPEVFQVLGRAVPGGRGREEEVRLAAS
jgi:hypothetical protein